MPRVPISMTEQEALAFLATRDETYVGVLHDDRPVATVARYELSGGWLTFYLAPDDPELGAVRSHGQVCCIVEQSPSYHEIRSVIVHGAAQEQPQSGPLVPFRVPLDDLVSFDFGKLPH